MGNQNNVISCDGHSRAHSQKSQNKITNFLSSKLQKKLSKQRQSSDDFFVKYTQLNTLNDTLIDVRTLDKRRTVFVSILGLFLTWKKLPSHILYTSIFILPTKSKWIHCPEKYSTEIASSLISELSPLSDMEETCQFMEMLKWKNGQGLLFNMLDDYEYPKNVELNIENQLVAPFWFNLNEKLTQLYNPITGKKYKPVHLNVQYYENKETFMSKFSVSASSILRELYFLQMKFKSISEIIYASNPLSLNPIQSYDYVNNKMTVDLTMDKKTYLLEEMDDEDKDNWWISAEYDPDDIDDDLFLE